MKECSLNSLTSLEAESRQRVQTVQTDHGYVVMPEHTSQQFCKRSAPRESVKHECSYETSVAAAAVGPDLVEGEHTQPSHARDEKLEHVISAMYLKSSDNLMNFAFLSLCSLQQGS